MSTEPKMLKKISLCSIIIGSLIVVAGYIAGGLIYFAFQIAPIGNWEIIANPPVKPIELLDYSIHAVYFKAEDGDIYSCNIFTGECCKDVLPTVKLFSSSNSWNCFVPSPPPYKIIDSLEIKTTCIDTHSQTNLILFEDGRIYRWHRMFGGASGPLLFSLCATSGAVISAIVLGRIRKKGYLRIEKSISRLKRNTKKL